MRHSYHGEWLENDKGEFLGISLGSDYCAEHEFGIKGIKDMFGIDSNKLGIDGRSISVVPNEYVFKKLTRNGQSCYLLVFDKEIYIEGLKSSMRNALDILQLYPFELSNGGFSASWCEHGFAILVSYKYKDRMELIRDSILNKDAIIFLYGGGPFRNAGLCVMIKSRVSEDVSREMYEADDSYFKLKRAAHETGIAKKLKEAGKRYYALSPKWKDDSHTEVIFWLNPEEQNKNNYGWFTVKDLEDWINGEGKIPKNNLHVRK